jgi:hypothetical protein
MIGYLFIVGGLGILFFATQLSALEKRLLEKFSWTRVTGWAGTSRGVYAWRFGGLLITISGLLLLYVES